MTVTFGLLHGGCHHGWCYDRLVPELRSRGYDAVAVDMPFEDPSAGITGNAEAVVRSLAAHEDVVLVAHSMGGLIAPVAARLRPVRHLVLLCAVVPEPGLSFAEQNLDPSVIGPSTVPAQAMTRDEQGTTRFASAQALHDHLYQDCDDATVQWAWERVGSFAATIAVEKTPLTTWPDVPTTSVIATRDGAVNPDWSRIKAKAIGASIVELEGSSHSPFASRPAELADVLVHIATG
jgi:pimeloyl-ACP methyl ester carboxylesterase